MTYDDTTRKIVSEMTYNVSSGTLNPAIPYLQDRLVVLLNAGLVSRRSYKIWRHDIYPCGNVREAQGESLCGCRGKLLNWFGGSKDCMPSLKTPSIQHKGSGKRVTERVKML